ncbi:MAG: hypothetical protein QM539_05410 [Alphaproteobacteria bacterium]|nr:hypothetical protein [Alphaproteobacteria bacterium]
MSKKKSKLERPLHIFVCVGAAVVIFGAMAKILHLSWADIALKAGLTTEALIFLMYAFLPPEGSHEASAVAPQIHIGGNAQKLNDMLEKANINEETLQILSNNFSKLNQTVNAMYESSVFSQDFQNQIQVMNNNLTSLNTIYSQEIQNVSSQFKTLNQSLNNLTDTSNTIVAISQDAAEAHQQIKSFSNNLSKLNTVYGTMLQAMQIK